MKRTSLTAMLMALAVLASTLAVAGCGSSGGSSTAKSTTPPARTTTPTTTTTTSHKQKSKPAY